MAGPQPEDSGHTVTDGTRGRDVCPLLAVAFRSWGGGFHQEVANGARPGSGDLAVLSCPLGACCCRVSAHSSRASVQTLGTQKIVTRTRWCEMWVRKTRFPLPQGESARPRGWGGLGSLLHGPASVCPLGLCCHKDSRARKEAQDPCVSWRQRVPLPNGGSLLVSFWVVRSLPGIPQPLLTP